jgi:hypothetical protein
MVSSATGELNSHVANAVLALQAEDLNRQKIEQTITQLGLLQEVNEDSMQALRAYEAGDISYEDMQARIKDKVTSTRARVKSAEINTVFSDKVKDVDAGDIELF